MENLPAVEAAKALMMEALAWSVVKWLRQKKEVRNAADQANAALDQLSRGVKDRWPTDVRGAYEAISPQVAAPANTPGGGESNTPAPNRQVMLKLRKVIAADQEAYRARMHAEETFDLAEKQLSTALAREGCRQAIQSWELHEKAIRTAEALIPSREPVRSPQEEH